MKNNEAELLDCGKDGTLARLSISQYRFSESVISLLTDCPTDGSGGDGAFYVRGIGGGDEMPHVRAALEYLIGAINNDSTTEGFPVLVCTNNLTEVKIRSGHDIEDVFLVIQKTEETVSMTIKKRRISPHTITFTSSKGAEINTDKIIIQTNERVMEALRYLFVAACLDINTITY